MAEKNKWLRFLIRWRIRTQNDYYLLVTLSIIVGFLSGLAAAIIKHAVRLIETFLDNDIPEHLTNYLHLIYPIVGIGLAVFFMVYILRQKVDHGIPSILYAISKNQAYLKPHNLYSSIVTSALTVGFGGSVGLEGPTVATGGGIGSTIGSIFKINYREKIILLGAASAGAMSAIFKAPMAGVVFALEVIMIDLTTFSIIPILLAAVTGSLTSFLLLGTNVLYPFELKDSFYLSQTWYFVVLGVITGLVAVYFTKVYILVEKFFNNLQFFYPSISHIYSSFHFTF
jgi:CIC family chloride channel protein